MAQYLRPSSNVTQTSVTGGFAEIDEATRSDTDYAYGAVATNATLEVHLSDPTATPGSGTTTIRYTVAATNSSGTVQAPGNAPTITAYLYQGTTLIATDTSRSGTGSWVQYTWTPNVSSVTDWTDLRLRFVLAGSGGGPNSRGGAISWAELEAPDAPSPVTLTVENLAQTQALTSPVLAAGLPMWIGTTAISSVYLGSTQITAAYKGSTQLW